jgi:hypothetical protein
MAREEHTFGVGAFVPAGPNPFARWHFLSVLLQTIPEPLEELAVLAKDHIGPDEAEYTDWARRWHFDVDPWLKSVAVGTLHRWRDYPSLLDAPLAWHKAPISEGWQPDYRPDPPLVWNPRSEPEASFRLKVDDYINAVKNAESASPSGSPEGAWVEPTAKRNLNHFEWLALYQVGGWTQARISERYQDEGGTPDVTAVSKALTTTAAMIGLVLRNESAKLK